MNRRYLLAAFVIASQLMQGCATTSVSAAQDRYVSPQFVPPPPGSLLLLLHLPANEPAYRSRDADVRQLVANELMKAGYRVAFVEPDDYRFAVRAELQELRSTTAAPSSGQLAEAEMRALATVSKVGSEASGGHLLVRTRLLTRSAELWQSYAKWDGVSRPIVFEGSSPGEVQRNIGGTAPGISVEVIATGRDGRLLLKSYGGVALPFYASRSGQPVLLDDPLSVPQHLQEGVGIALSPLKLR